MALVRWLLAVAMSGVLMVAGESSKVAVGKQVATKWAADADVVPDLTEWSVEALVACKFVPSGLCAGMYFGIFVVTVVDEGIYVSDENQKTDEEEGEAANDLSQLNTDYKDIRHLLKEAREEVRVVMKQGLDPHQATKVVSANIISDLKALMDEQFLFSQQAQKAADHIVKANSQDTIWCSWFGLWCSPKVPDDVRSKLNAASAKMGNLHSDFAGMQSCLDTDCSVDHLQNFLGHAHMLMQSVCSDLHSAEKSFEAALHKGLPCLRCNSSSSTAASLSLAGTFPFNASTPGSTRQVLLGEEHNVMGLFTPALKPLFAVGSLTLCCAAVVVAVANAFAEASVQRSSDAAQPLVPQEMRQRGRRPLQIFAVVIAALTAASFGYGSAARTASLHLKVLIQEQHLRQSRLNIDMDELADCKRRFTDAVASCDSNNDADCAKTFRSESFLVRECHRVLDQLIRDTGSTETKSGVAQI